MKHKTSTVFIFSFLYDLRLLEPCSFSICVAQPNSLFVTQTKTQTMLSLPAAVTIFSPRNFILRCHFGPREDDQITRRASVSLFLHKTFLCCRCLCHEMKCGWLNVAKSTNLPAGLAQSKANTSTYSCSSYCTYINPWHTLPSTLKNTAVLRNGLIFLIQCCL